MQKPLNFLSADDFTLVVEGRMVGELKSIRIRIDDGKTCLVDAVARRGERLITQTYILQRIEVLEGGIFCLHCVEVPL